MEDGSDGTRQAADERPPHDGGFLVASCVLSLALAALVLWDVADLPPPMFGPIGSGDLPAAVAWILIALALAVLGASLVRRRNAAASGPDPAAPARRPAVGRMLLVLALTTLYALAITSGAIDFGLLSTGYLALSIACLARPRGLSLVLALALSAAIGLGSDALFTNVLFIDLP